MKKRILRALILVSITLFILVAPILASSPTWTYQFPINIKDTSGTARNYVPVDLGITGTNLNSSGYMASSGLDTYYFNGSFNTGLTNSQAYMVSTTHVLGFVPSLGAYSQVPTNFYTGCTTDGSNPQTSMAVLVGHNGYVTTSDNANLEPGSNFAIETDGYVDTSSGSNKYLVGKSGELAIDAGSTTAGYITSQFWSNTVSASQTNQPSYYPVQGSNWYGETFTPTKTFISGVSLYLGKNATPVNTVTISIYATSSNLPTGAPLVSYTNTTFTPNAWNDCYFSKVIAVSTSSVYAVVMSDPSDSGSNYWEWFYTGSGGTAGNQSVSSTNSGSSWSANGTIMMAYKIYGGGMAQASVASGAHTIGTSYNGSTLTLTVDSNNTNATTNSAVLDNANNWVWMQNDAMPYATLIKETVSGVDKLKYQPTTMLTDTTLPNILNSGTYDGTITYGSNSSITLTYGAIGSYNTTTNPSISSGTIGTHAGSFTMPTNWFTAGSNITALPAYPMIASIFNNSTLPSPIAVYQVAWFAVFLLGFALLAAWVKSMMLTVGWTFVFSAYGITSTILPVWFIFGTLILIVGTIWVWRQQ